MNNTVRTVVIMIVSTVWAINFTAPVFVTEYKPSPELNVAFMAIIGVLTASYKIEKNGKDDPPPPDPKNPNGESK
jgi:hypothetical protein